ncbi:uncharacterized protein [Chelonus insularis]|uniref:uncharacterized protein isoform X2 n=1 Tax=Chelonus insularis TaxID=460826 RepID=UPI0015885129|nr:uncharacterized protein LOC118068697 isoform X2 [Chelonus insularis]
MSSDESFRGFDTISSTPHPKKIIKEPIQNFASPLKLSVNDKIKRKKRLISASKPKKRKTESFSSTDNVYSSTFLRKTTSSSQSSKSSFRPNKQKKISFSPIQKFYTIPSRLEVDHLPSSSEKEESLKNTIPEIIIDECMQDNKLIDYEDISNKIDSKNDTVLESPATDDDDNLVESFSCLSTASEEERNDIKDFVTKRPEHSVKKKEIKHIRKEINNARKSTDESTSFRHKKQFFPRYYPLGWMAVYSRNVGSDILKRFLTSQQKLVSLKRKSFQTYGEWKKMRKEGLLLDSPTPHIKEEEYTLPIEATVKNRKISKKKNKKRSLKMEKNEYYKNSIKKESKSEVLSIEDIKQDEKEIRENSSIPNETSGPQNLSDDFAHVINNPNTTMRRHETNSIISERKETSETSNTLKNKIKIISDIEFEDSTKIRIPYEIWSKIPNLFDR